jgi:hypothetical protein
MSERPTPETDTYCLRAIGFPTGYEWREFARKLERQRDQAKEELLKLRVENDHNWQAVAELEKMTELARELRDALEAVYYIDLSPCNGGSCMVATNADDAIDAIKNKAAPLLTKAKEVLP